MDQVLSALLVQAPGTALKALELLQQHGWWETGFYI